MEKKKKNPGSSIPYQTYMSRLFFFIWRNDDLLLGHGFSQSVRKSTTGCSISRTVVVLPCMMVMLGVWEAFSMGNPPEKRMNGSLEGERKNKK